MTIARGNILERLRGMGLRSSVLGSVLNWTFVVLLVSPLQGLIFFAFCSPVPLATYQSHYNDRLSNSIC